MACSKPCCSIVFTVIGVVLVVLAVILGWVIFPMEVQRQIKQSVILKNGTEQYDRWLKTPMPLNFKVYLFHILNADEAATTGAKIQVEERGPYIYKQWREKILDSITYDEEAKEYTYLERELFEFDAEASKPLKESDPITMLNTPMNAFFQIIEDDPLLSWMAPLINKHFDSVFPNQETIFVKTTVQEQLFGGYPICKNPKTGAKLICRQINSFAPKEVVKQEDGSYLFSYFSHKHDSNDGYFTAQSGEADFHLTGQFTAYNFSKYTEYWNGENFCSEVYGTDAVIFPPLIKRDDLISIYHPDICRRVDIAYAGEKVTYKGVKGLRYQLTYDSLAAPNESSGTECYCLNKTRDMFGERTCMKYGALELYSCHGAPIILTLPHLYTADEFYTKNTVENLQPDPEKHITYVDLETGTGTPLRGTKRVQFNMFVRPINIFSKFTKNVKPAIVPMLWIDEGVELTDELIDLLKGQYLNILDILNYVTWGLLGFGVLLTIASGISLCVIKRRQSSQTV